MDFDKDEAILLQSTLSTSSATYVRLPLMYVDNAYTVPPDKVLLVKEFGISSDNYPKALFNVSIGRRLLKDVSR
jgi:hypothetical protein